MFKFDKIYKIKRAKNEKVNKISKKLNISPLISNVLVNRGIDTLDECVNFLDTDLNNLFNPFLLKDMGKAVDKIVEVVNKGKKICIYGDYDADGITSVSILKLFFDNIGANSFYYIPNRLKEGYGINKDAIDYIYSLDTSLVITVDCGITNFEEVDYLNKKNIDVIITDHHQCEDVIPNAFAVINPNRKDCSYPFKQLAGVGVAFKLVQALSNNMNILLKLEEILPIITIGTIADIVPLVGENRIIVKNGLMKMKGSQNMGLQALIEVSGLKGKDINSYHVGFVLGPRLNASGRLGFAKEGVELFLARNYKEALRLAKNLDEENIRRQRIENEILEEVEKEIEDKIDLDEDKVIVLASSNWHSGVIGIVASRIVEKFHRPTILFAIEGEKARGSARSISTFNIYSALSKCDDLFITFGGHKQAAGMLISTESIKEFKTRVNKIAKDILDECDLIPEIDIDCEIKSKDVTIETGEELKDLEPFGVGNPSPKFIFKNGIIKNTMQMGKNKEHMKLALSSEEKIVEAVGFNFGNYANILNSGDKIDLIVSLDINEYMGKRAPQLLIRDIVDKNKKSLDENYCRFMRKCFDIGEENTDIDFDFKQVSTLVNCSRLDYAIQSLKYDENTLLLVFNYFNVKEILESIRIEGRSILKRIDICFNSCENKGKNSLLILPMLKDLNVKEYKKVILYDMAFSNYSLYDFLEDNENKKIEILTTKEDIELNKKVLVQIIPTIDEMRLIYKVFLSLGEENFRIDSIVFLNSINNRFKKDVTIGKLNLILDVFKDCNFLDFLEVDNSYYIKLLPKTNKKVDILEVPKVKYLYKLKKSISK